MTAPHNPPAKKQDDAVREVHGCKCAPNGPSWETGVLISEMGDDLIRLQLGNKDGALTQWQARYLAAKLYRLSRRIRARQGVPS
jgi:hypothetical protein